MSSSRSTPPSTPLRVRRWRSRVSSSLEQHRDWIAEYVELGVDQVFCFNVAKDQRRFIEAFAEKVLPLFVEVAGESRGGRFAEDRTATREAEA